jgi:hypothetical protein
MMDWPAASIRADLSACPVDISLRAPWPKA